MSLNTINFTENFVKTFPALSYKNFRYFWSGQCISLLGTWMQRTALSFIYYLVGKEALTNGIALNSAIVNMARLIGPALAAILIVNFGAGFCFFLNGISFISVIIGLSRISQQAETKPKHEKILTATLDGLKYIKANPVIFVPVLAMLVVGTFAMNFDVILPVFADKVLHNGAQGYGFLLSSSGFGSLLSALFVVTKVKNNPSPKLLSLSGMMVSVLMILAFFIHTYGFAVVDITIIGFFNMLFMTLVNSTIQLSVDDNFRGRVMSVYTLAFAGTTPIGNLFAGSIIQRFGPGMGFLMCGAATGLLLITLMVWMARRKKRTGLNNC